MNVKRWQIISTIISIIAGILLHFAYEWSGNNQVIGIFSAVNESTWEHLKLAFFPMVFMDIIGYFLFGKNANNYIKANALGIIITIAFITIFFYTYTGIIGNNFAWLNIATFIVGVILGECFAYKIIQSDVTGESSFYLEIIGVLLILFIAFTFIPPHINYFRDPITGTYGIKRQVEE